jgi:hypothetical protein
LLRSWGLESKSGKLAETVGGGDDGRAADKLDQPQRPGRHGIALSVGGATGKGQLRLAAQWVTGCAAHVVAGASTVWACWR